ncbi:hypothetical protein MGG_09545 [Pyricularia oryzae 70-15]|uniref:Sulfate transporter n=3 Tax=Pyricularia oryzae TaxID=318829 RepID=G4N1B8_PYRO7|nr:uncharacterized protein MGG_09545 [Pyricularia oryzae 70-15]EHA52389.1 hypothetical protein MGG_09545 [Pyricularia oryzae 70-15]ELQ38234.1 hypothetical protein OOU_Y34scaffold00548g50 [Pyricularia oryzae Y34]KAI7916511.1 hypothetical protein M9X92_007839 [Pyricularia oryzae]KAI7926331.1 hypothetical protein M0657_003792 [Pyricularia oryzae]
MAIKDIPKLNRNSIRTLRHDPLSEISGALGDLGTLLPLMIALALQSSISLSTTLVFSGIFNVLTGIVFGIPLPVQPMKAIAAAAIAEHTSLRQTVAAGGLVSAAVLILSATGLLRRATRLIPVPVAKGIQFGAGLSLVISAGSSLLQPLHWLHPILDNRLWAFGALVGLVVTHRFRRVPYALIVFILGTAFAAVAVATSGRNLRLPGVAPWVPFLVLPAWTSPVAISMAVAQLPLTTLNSVIAVSALSADLLPNLPTPTVTEMGLSVASMNLIGCWFGAMPVCHGAGGLAAQHRFGARSGASIIILGIFKILLGLILGETLLDLLDRFPHALLGIMVLASGLELAGVGQSLNHGAADLWESSMEGNAPEALSTRIHRSLSEEERAERWSVMLITTAGILAFKNDAVGFAAGMLSHWTYRAAQHWGRGTGERQPLISRPFH